MILFEGGGGVKFALPESGSSEKKKQGKKEVRVVVPDADGGGEKVKKTSGVKEKEKKAIQAPSAVRSWKGQNLHG